MQLEYDRLEVKVDDLSEKQSSDATRDGVVFTIGLLVFFPAWFGLAADDHGDALAQAKGERNAVVQKAINTDCQFAENIDSPKQPDGGQEKQSPESDGDLAQPTLDSFDTIPEVRKSSISNPMGPAQRRTPPAVGIV